MFVRLYVDNSLAKARGLSLLSGGQTMLYHLLHVTFPSFLQQRIFTHVNKAELLYKGEGILNGEGTFYDCILTLYK